MPPVVPPQDCHVAALLAMTVGAAFPCHETLCKAGTCPRPTEGLVSGFGRFFLLIRLTALRGRGKILLNYKISQLEVAM